MNTRHPPYHPLITTNSPACPPTWLTTCCPKKGFLIRHYFAKVLEMRSSDAKLLFQIFFSLLSTENSAATNHVPTAANQSTEFVLATATTNVDESAEGESSQINYHHQDKCHQNWRLQNVRMKYQRCTLYSHYHVDTFDLQTLCEWPGL